MLRLSFLLYTFFGENKVSEKPEEIITDEEIERVHANANFGSIGKRQVINQGVLKCACGYYQGHTSTQISV